MSTQHLNLLLQGDIAFDLSRKAGTNDSVNGRIDLNLVLFGASYKYADVKLRYRTNPSADWQEDMHISSVDGSDQFSITQGMLCGLSCSLNGVTHTIRWEYSLNNISSGTQCEVKVEVLPSILRFGRGPIGITTLESSCGELSKRMEDSAYHGPLAADAFLGRDRAGNYMVFRGGHFVVEDENAVVLMQSVATYDNLVQAKHTENRTYLFLDNGVNTGVPALHELYESADPAASSLLLGGNPTIDWFDYDPIAKTVIHPINAAPPGVMEISWDYNEIGNLLWSYTLAGLLPVSGAYDFMDKDVIWTIVGTTVRSIDRHSRLAPTVTTLALQRYSQAWASLFSAASTPVIKSTKDYLLICSQKGEVLVQNTVATSHPTLLREASHQVDEADITSKNQFPEYQNLVFAPTRAGYEGD